MRRPGLQTTTIITAATNAAAGLQTTATTIVGQNAATRTALSVMTNTRTDQRLARYKPHAFILTGPRETTDSLREKGIKTFLRLPGIVSFEGVVAGHIKA